MGLHLPKRARRIGLATVLTVGLLVLSACSAEDKDQIARFAMPEGITDRAPFIYDLWRGAWIAALIVGVIVWGLILYAAIKFRRRSDDEIPVQTRYNLPIEVLYTVAPIVIVVVLFFFTVRVQSDVLANVSDDDAKADHNITVVGQQWSWTFNYVKDQALDGSTSVHEVGTTAYRPTLVLPVGESVKVTLRSADVAHSFWVPGFLMKMDVIPGLRNHFSFTPTTEGDFVGRCAELCGVYHSRMLFNVKVVSPEQYASYLQGLEDKGQTGLALGGEAVDKQSGLKVGQNEDNGAGE